MICYTKYLKIFALLSGIYIFSISCSDSPSGGDDEEQDEEQNQDEELVLKAPGYPDDYSEWSGFAYRDLWGPYNLHDPGCLPEREWTYCFSTDVAYDEMLRAGVMMRRSKNLVDREFVGWGFSGIPDEAYNYVVEHNEEAPGNIWAPYIMKSEDTYRLYYSVSVFGSPASSIGLATSSSLDDPWSQEGAVLTSTQDDGVNAIDPSVITDADNTEFTAWELQDKIRELTGSNETLELYLSDGYDWENYQPAVVFTGLNSAGRSIWGKKIK